MSGKLETKSVTVDGRWLEVQVMEGERLMIRCLDLLTVNEVGYVGTEMVRLIHLSGELQFKPLDSGTGRFVIDSWKKAKA